MLSAEEVIGMLDARGKADFIVWLSFKNQAKSYREMSRLLGTEKYLQVCLKFPGILGTPNIIKLSNWLILFRLTKMMLDSEEAYDRGDNFTCRQLSNRVESHLHDLLNSKDAARAKVEEEMKTLKAARLWWAELESLEKK